MASMLSLPTSRCSGGRDLLAGECLVLATLCDFLGHDHVVRHADLGPCLAPRIHDAFASSTRSGSTGSCRRALPWASMKVIAMPRR